jgi:Zn-dependent protease
MGIPTLRAGVVFGIPLRLHASWFVTAGLLTAVLATGSFPRYLPASAPALHWACGLAGALGLFGSVLLHELAHATMARRRGLPVIAITLHGLGGVAEFGGEPASPADEIWTAVVGPLTSYALALASGVALTVPGAPPAATAVLAHLVAMNLTVGTFNLIPGLPLDGGRLLRAVLWARHGDHGWATTLASRVGAAVAMGLVALGVLSLIRTGSSVGLWLVAVGVYLRRAAGAAGVRLNLQRLLEPIPVRVAMTFGSGCAPAHASVADLVRDHPATAEVGCAVRGDDGAVVGVVTSRALDGVPPERRSATRVEDVMVRLRDDMTTEPAASCWEAFCKLDRAAEGRLLVIEDGRLVGTVGLQNLRPLLVWSRPAA